MISNEVKPQQVRLWGGIRKVLRVHGVRKGNISKPREGVSHTRDGVTQDCERNPKTHRKESDVQQVRLERNGQILALLQDTETGLCLDGRV